STHEQEHIIAAYSVELGKVEREWIRARQVNEILANIDLELAKRVAQNLGLPVPKHGTVDVPELSLDHSPALSQANLLSGDIKTRKGAILAANGVDG
ncbi:catalase-related domain-containing protein, partial [Pseudomonas chlororaphis]|uniref:catalase-related domain-containing protein n=1 Tax=Pseudomonas chlororaphis TaxID=587753 RepID=UPI0028832F59